MNIALCVFFGSFGCSPCANSLRASGGWTLFVFHVHLAFLYPEALIYQRKFRSQLPTVWTDEKQRGEESESQREEKSRREKIREEKESEERRSRCPKR